MRASLTASTIFLFLAAAVSGCSGGPRPGDATALEQAERQAVAYQLGTGDRLRVTVFNEDNISGTYTVSADGTIALPLVGNIPAAGKTIPQFQADVTRKLEDGYVQEPKVSIEATNLRPYYILGEVNKPGKYSYAPNLTILDAVATAEGFTYRADTSTVYIKRAREVAEQTYPLTSTTAVYPGDTIRITERFF